MALHKKLTAKVTKHFSKLQLSIFAVLFAGIGGYFVINSFAATAACTITVSQGANIATTVSNAAAGSVICLNTGTYGMVSLTNISKSSDVTIQSTSGKTATIGLDLYNVNHLRVESVTLAGMEMTNQTKNITVTDNTITAQVMINMGSNGGNYGNASILIDKNIINPISVCTNCYEGRVDVISELPSGVTISNNQFNGPGESDGIQLGADGVVIRGNTFDGIIQGSYGRHVDAVQLYGASNTTIDGNYFKNGGSYIMAPDGGDHEIITNNVFVEGDYNPAVQMGSHDTTTFSHNTVIGISVHMTRKYERTDNSTNGIIKDNIFTSGGGLNFIVGDGPTPRPSGCTNCIVDYNYGGGGTHPITGTIKFVGGANPTSYAGYELASDSAGNNAGSDSKDVGINITSTLPPGVSANVWVNTSAGTSPARCSSACVYDPIKAYGSLNAAYQAARGGDTIRVVAGSYGAQTITNNAVVNNDAQPVVIRSNGNGQVSFTGEVKILANYVTLDGQSTTTPYDFKNDNYVFQIGESGNEGMHDVIVNNFDGRNFWIKAAHHIAINGGDWGPSIACRAGTYPGAQLENQITGTSGVASTPHDIKLEGLLIHDQNTDNPTACHTGGLIFQGGYNIEIKKNKFRQNAIYDILFDDFTGTFRTDAITIENNWFGPPVEPYSIDSSGATVSPAQADVQVKWNGVAAKDWLIRYNSFGSGLALAWGGSPPSWTNVRILGNTGGNTWRGTSWDTCAGVGLGAVVKYNAFVGIDNLGSSGASAPTCGDSSNVSLGKVNGYGLSTSYPYASTSNTNIDFHLKTATTAKDLVTQITGDYALATDIDGDARPKGTSNDAGADEATSSASTKPGDTNGDNVVNIVDLSTLLSKWNTNFVSADFNKDNTVNIVDLSILLSNYGK